MGLFGSGKKIQNEDVLKTLSNVLDPDLQNDIVTLGFVKNLKIDAGKIYFDLELTTPACPVKDQLKSQCVDLLKALPGVTDVDVNLTAQVRPLAGISNQRLTVRGVKHLIAVASGKGGVGKSTTAVNLAAALQVLGAKVGIFDADIYGPSIPLMLGIRGRPKTDEQNTLYPMKAHGMEMISMGVLTDENTPVIWRGPMVGGVIQQFLSQTQWSDLDYLIVDLPPGTGDAQLTLCQKAPLSGAVIVTTPQEVSLLDARKGLLMFEKVQVPVLGIIENMSAFICSKCSEVHHIFRRGGGRRVSEQLGVPFLGEVPLETQVCESGDSGIPSVIKFPDAISTKIYLELAKQVASEISKLQMGSGLDISKLSLEWKRE